MDIASSQLSFSFELICELVNKKRGSAKRFLFFFKN